MADGFDPSVIINALLPMIMGNQGGSSGMGGQAGELMPMIMSRVMGNLMPGIPGSDRMGKAIGMSLQEPIFGEGPFSGYGSFGSPWNAATRMTEWSRYRLSRSFEEQSARVINNFTNDETQRVLAKNTWLSPNLAELGVKAWTSMRGAQDLGTGMFSASSALGYQFGDRANTSVNDAINKNITNVSTTILKDWLAKPNEYMGMTGKDMGDVFRGMVSTGAFNQRGGSMDFEAKDVNADDVKSKIQTTTRALSSIRDIIKGDVPQVIEQLRGIFGGSIVGDEGLMNAARGVNKLRMMADVTGTRVGDMLQYAQGSGMLGQQITGRTEGGLAGGLVSSSILASNTQAIRGVDMGRYAQDVVARTTGGQWSGVGTMLSGAMASLNTKEEQAKFEAAIRGNTGILTPEKISELLKSSTGLSMSASDILSASRSDAAIRMSSENTFGAEMAVAQQNRRSGMYRENIIKAAFGSDFAKLKGAIGDMDVGSLSLEELETFGGRADISKRAMNVISGYMTPRLDAVAQSLGFQNSNAQSSFMRAQARSGMLLGVAKEMGELGEAYQNAGGGIMGIIGTMNLSDVGGNGVSALGMLKKGFGIADTDKVGGISVGGTKDLLKLYGANAREFMKDSFDLNSMSKRNAGVNAAIDKIANKTLNSAGAREAINESFLTKSGEDRLGEIAEMYMDKDPSLDKKKAYEMASADKKNLDEHVQKDPVAKRMSRIQDELMMDIIAGPGTTQEKRDKLANVTNSAVYKERVAKVKESLEVRAETLGGGVELNKMDIRDRNRNIQQAIKERITDISMSTSEEGKKAFERIQNGQAKDTDTVTVLHNIATDDALASDVAARRSKLTGTTWSKEDIQKEAANLEKASKGDLQEQIVELLGGIKSLIDQVVTGGIPKKKGNEGNGEGP